MNNFILFKDLTPGSTIYALIKNPDELDYVEGSIVTVGQQRVDMPDFKNGQVPNFSQAPKTVVDVAYSLDGKNYTDAETLMSYLGMQDLDNGNRETLFKLVYKLALNKLCDKDKMFNIREYFKL